MKTHEETGKLMGIPGREEGEEWQVPTALDSAAGQFGALPWWIISAAFHGLTLLLISLLTMVVIKYVSPLTPVTIVPPTPPTPPPDRIKTPALVENPVKFRSDEETEAPVVFFHETPEDSNHVETPDERDEQSARGLEGYTDFWSEGKGISAALGLGGPPGGRFGFRGRGGRRLLATRGWGKETVPFVDLALAWLAAHQERDGHWDTRKYEADSKTDTACTGLALLAFLGSGYTEKVGQYQDNVRRAVAWLKSVQSPNGCLYAPEDGGTAGPGYAHAIAGMALAEAAGMARVADTRRAAQKAIDYTCHIHGQGQARDDYDGLGPWRYKPQMPADLSVTGWFIMQLKSAKVCGLAVPEGSFQKAQAFLDAVQEKTGADEGYGPGFRFFYMPEKRTYSGANKEERLAAIGALGRLFLGQPPEKVRGAVEHFIQTGGVPQAQHWDLYYWYYGTLAAFQFDGPRGPVWKRWNEGMKETLLKNQRQDGDERGSWDPQGDFSHKWGRVGQTALACLCLEVYYRYLPMYR